MSSKATEQPTVNFSRHAPLIALATHAAHRSEAPALRRMATSSRLAFRLLLTATAAPSTHNVSHGRFSGDISEHPKATDREGGSSK